MMMLNEKYRPLLAPDGPAGGSGGASSPAPGPSSAPSGAPSSAPSSGTPTPPSGAPAPSPAASPPSAGEGFDFGSMFDMEPPTDSVRALSAPTEVPAVAPAATPPPGPLQEPSAPAAPGTELPATEVGAPAVAQPAAPETPGQSTPPDQPSAGPYIDPYDPAMLSQHLTQNEAGAVELVADRLFQLSPAEKEALEQDVIGTVPKLLAKVFVKSQQNVLQQLGRIIPVMMQRHLSAVKRNTGNEDQFYSRWPDINREKHGDTVVKYAAVYRQMHPQATLGQMIEDLGPMVMMAQKIVPQSHLTAPKGPTTGRPAAPGNGRSPQPSPFVPAGGGATTAPRSVEVEPWEAMFRQQE